MLTHNVARPHRMCEAYRAGRRAHRNCFFCARSLDRTAVSTARFHLAVAVMNYQGLINRQRSNDDKEYQSEKWCGIPYQVGSGDRGLL